MPVYAAGYGKCPVKIQKRGSRWAVYRLDKLKCKRVMYKDPYKGTKEKCTFIWDKRASETFSYKPYENKDVLSSPRTLVKHVKTWCPFLIRRV